MRHLLLENATHQAWATGRGSVVVAKHLGWTWVWTAVWWKPWTWRSGYWRDRTEEEFLNDAIAAVRSL